MDDPDVELEAVRSLRALILAGERYRQVLSEHVGLGTTETQAISYLTVHGDRGQNELAADLGLSSGASTALVESGDEALAVPDLGAHFVDVHGSPLIA